MFGSKWRHWKMSWICQRNSQTGQTHRASIGKVSATKSSTNAWWGQGGGPGLLPPVSLRAAVPVECIGCLPQTLACSHTNWWEIAKKYLHSQGTLIDYRGCCKIYYRWHSILIFLLKLESHPSILQHLLNDIVRVMAAVQMHLFPTQ